MKRRHWLLILLAVAPPMVAACLPRLALAAPLTAEAAVETTHDALDSGWRYPWYDGANDRLRKIRSSEFDWNFDWFNRPTGGLSASTLKIIMWSIVILALLILIYALVRVYLNINQQPAFSLTAGAASGANSPEDDARRVESLPFALDARRQSLLDLARAAADAGDYSRAVVYLYSHELVELDRRHLIRLTRGKTNRQYLREVAGQRDLRQLLEQTMIAFEDAFFGNVRLTRERFERCWSQLSHFSQLAQAAS